MIKKLKFPLALTWLFALFFLAACEKEMPVPPVDAAGGSGGGGGGSSSDAKIGTWARNDGQAQTYLRLTGSTAITCNSGTKTTGTYNASAATMTYTVSGTTYVFPLAMSGTKLIVKVPVQGTNTHNDTEYIRTTTWPCQ